MSEKILILLIIGPVIGIFGILFWKHTILVVFCAAIFEGAFRKWILPEYQAEIYLIKDLMLLSGYFGFVLSNSARRRHVHYTQSLTGMVLILFLFCSVQLANSNSPSLILSLIGFKNYLLYIPLAFIIPYVIDTRVQLVRYLKIFFVISVPVCVLGLYQFTQPPSSWVNAYVWHDSGATKSVAMFGESGEFARTTGTFSFITGYVSFLIAVFLLSASYIIHSSLKIRKSLIAYFVCALAVMAMFTTGSRLPILIVGVAIPILLFLGASTGQLDAKAGFRIFWVTAVLAVIIGFFGGTPIEAFSDRAATADSWLSRVLFPFRELMDASGSQPILGLGMGSTAPSAFSILKTDYPYWLNGYLFESETARVVQEIGIFGFIIVYGIRVYVTYLVFKLIKIQRDGLGVSLTAAVFVFVLIHTMLSVVNNPTAGLYYWGGVGLVFATVNLGKRARVKEAWHSVSKARPNYLNLPQ